MCAPLYELRRSTGSCGVSGRPSPSVALPSRHLRPVQANSKRAACPSALSRVEREFGRLSTNTGWHHSASAVLNAMSPQLSVVDERGVPRKVLVAFAMRATVLHLYSFVGESVARAANP